MSALIATMQGLAGMRLLAVRFKALRGCRLRVPSKSPPLHDYHIKVLLKPVIILIVVH